jgi:hypothetical protein
MHQAIQARGNGRSQATVIEQSRAIAEVQGALLVADRRPRDRQYALAEALESCRTQDVAQAAFFKFPRGGQSVSGPTIHLARELARCWGNVVYAVVELDRDDERHMSEMMAYAWDLETNTRSQTQFLVPHKRDKKGGAEVLSDMRDIYENNANMGARRLRECIFAILPPYLTKAAERTCHETLQGGSDEKPLPVRINEAIEAFDKIGISKDRIEAKLGPVGKFSAVDYANLRVSYGSIQRGEISAEDEFPRVDRLTGCMIADQSEAENASTKPRGRAAQAEKTKAETAGSDAGDDGEATGKDNLQVADDADPQRASKGKGAQADYIGARPANAQHGESWYNPDDEKLRYAHQTQHGIKWYFNAPAPADEGEGEAGIAEQTAREIDGPLDDAPPYDELVKRIVTGIDEADSEQALEAVKVEYAKHALSLPAEVAGGIERKLRDKRKALAGGEG